MEVELQSERILKGIAGNPPLKFTFTTTGFGEAGVREGQFGVFFLRKGPEGYEVLEPDYPFVIAAPGAPEVIGSVLDRVTAEVAHVLDTSGVPDGIKQQTLSVLASSQAPSATAALRQAARTQPLNVRLGAMGMLLARNDLTFLSEAQRLLLSDDPRIDQTRRDVVAGAIGFGVKDPRAIPLLEPLMKSRDLYVRRGAASALRNTRDPAAIRSLAAALYDADHQVRYFAVVGLGEVTGQNDWTPSVAYFVQNEQRFLDHWRNWAKAN